jgi:hypothetical protein
LGIELEDRYCEIARERLIAEARLYAGQGAIPEHPTRFLGPEREQGDEKNLTEQLEQSLRAMHCFSAAQFVRHCARNLVC